MSLSPWQLSRWLAAAALAALGGCATRDVPAHYPESSPASPAAYAPAAPPAAAALQPETPPAAAALQPEAPRGQDAGAASEHSHHPGAQHGH
jgi:hypothetical protein